MKRMICFLLIIVLLTACGTEKKAEIEPPEEEVCGAPLYEGPEESPDETVQVEFVCDGGRIVAQLPVDWQWEVDEITESAFAMGISFRPGTETEGWLRLRYWPGKFGVCGTGLEETEVTFANGLRGRMGFYDGSEKWSFISFYPDLPHYALDADFAGWVVEYEQQVFDILDTVKLG
ncbi:MAG: membrane lipoprotein lipid attachment site-containing protein [Clostridia bacterium]|nr:membrane lipoprotein lipid attachment site-containing protein [Clostridia bacterium]